MKKNRQLQIIAGHTRADGLLVDCSDPEVKLMHTAGSQVYEYQFPDDFRLITMNGSPYSQNAQVATYIPSPTAGQIGNSCRISTQTPIGTNAECDHYWIAVGY